MRVLVACEESQRVCLAFRKKGHEAYSCDIKPCSGGFPEWHIQDDVLKVLCFDWDLVIAHPPCTYLSKAGATRLFPDGVLDKNRYSLGLAAKSFFMQFYNCSVPRVCIENPTPLKIFSLPKPDCIIQPWEFGDPYTKRTCLWLKGLPPLLPTSLIVPSGSWTLLHSSPTVRSKTFPGVAFAMAQQWG